jgi:hypothetical protein
VLPKLLAPDLFAIGLLSFGIILFFVPLMKMPGVIALCAAGAYWLIMVVVRIAYKRS